MKYLLLLIPFFAFSQKADTIIKTDVFTSYYSKDLRLPIMVKYVLYKGGGECSRVGDVFHNDYKVNSVGAKEFKASGYDEGHLANAEDFAYDCKKQKGTFQFINQLPQTPNLNRGIWKHYETMIRDLSQHDSLVIVCGGIWEDNKVVNGMRIPNKCWKVVYSITLKKPIYILLFTNDNKATVRELRTVEELNLKTKIDYDIR
jgi:endonuclease G